MIGTSAFDMATASSYRAARIPLYVRAPFGGNYLSKNGAFARQIRLGAGELRPTDDRASFPTGGDHITVRHVEREDRVAAARSVRALSQTSVGDGYCDRGRILVARAPSGGLRSYCVGSSVVMAGSGELHLSSAIILRIGSCRAQSDGLWLTD